MKKLVILTVLLLSFSCAKQLPTFEDHLLAKFQTFKAAAEKAADKMKVEFIEVELLNKMHVHDNAQVASYTEESDLTGEVDKRVIHIAKSFLVNPDIILEHVAAHEVCHLYLNAGGEHSTEIAAERCVFGYEGGKRFYEVYTELYAQINTPLPSLEQVKRGLGIQ